MTSPSRSADLPTTREQSQESDASSARTRRWTLIMILVCTIPFLVLAVASPVSRLIDSANKDEASEQQSDDPGSSSTVLAVAGVSVTAAACIGVPLVLARRRRAREHERLSS